MKKAHYVTLVMTKSRSEADRFCQEKLIPIDPENNPFLCFNRSERQAYVVSSEIWVEVLCTENIDIDGALAAGGEITDQVDFKESSPRKPDGIRKRVDCRICNLYPRI